MKSMLVLMGVSCPLSDAKVGFLYGKGWSLRVGGGCRRGWGRGGGRGGASGGRAARGWAGCRVEGLFRWLAVCGGPRAKVMAGGWAGAAGWGSCYAEGGICCAVLQRVARVG